MNEFDKVCMSQNHLLAIIGENELAQLARHMEPVWLTAGTSLNQYQPGKSPSYGYFPTSAVVSLHHINESGATDETASVGNEGFVGISLILGGSSLPFDASVQHTGQAWRVAGATLTQAFNRGGDLAWALLRYTQALIAQMTLTMSCNCHHSVEQRLSFWLLTKLDRGISPDIHITQEAIAGALGVRREAVTLALGSLQRARLIKNGRGLLTIINRAGLKAVSCGCYAEMRLERISLLRDLQKRKSAGDTFSARSPENLRKSSQRFAAGNPLACGTTELTGNSAFPITW